MHTRVIPRTSEQLPVIGLGTWQTFDVGEAKQDRAACADVLKTFLAAGVSLVDSSPMYGRAEQVTGDELHGAKAFLATKVWTSGDLLAGNGAYPDDAQRERLAKLL